MKTFQNLMIELFNEQKNALKWFGITFLGIFILLSLATLTPIFNELSFQQVCYGALPLMSIFALLFLFCYEVDKTCAPYLQNKYRSLPVSTAQLYSASLLVSMLVFVGVAIILSIVSYLGLLQNTSFVGSISNQSQLAYYFETFPLIIFAVFGSFLSLNMIIQMVMLLGNWFSSYLPKSWKLTVQIIFIFLIFAGFHFISGFKQSFNGGYSDTSSTIAFNLNSDYSSFTFHVNNFVKIPSLKSLIAEIIFLLISAGISIPILDKFVETEEKTVFFGKAK
jgi:hypothetical protein